MSGIVLLIAGPSGSGKTTITRELVKRVPFLTRAITVTTRLPRPGEASGEDYHFVSPSRFAELNRTGTLVECAETYDESYGIPRSVLAGLCDRAIILTVGGALALRRRLPNSISIFIQPKSSAEAAARVIERNCPNSESRIAGYDQEVAASFDFDHVLVNEDVDQTVAELEGFYLRLRRQRIRGQRTQLPYNVVPKATVAGLALYGPRLQTSVDPGSPCHGCLYGSLGVIADAFPRWLRPYDGAEVSPSLPVKKSCTHDANLNVVMLLPPAAAPEVTEELDLVRINQPLERKSA
jgi:guanylate kinase